MARHGWRDKLRVMAGSTLELQVKGQRLVVRGYMARSHPRGCHFTRYRMAASCPLRDAGSSSSGWAPRDFVGS